MNGNGTGKWTNEYRSRCQYLLQHWHAICHERWLSDRSENGTCLRNVTMRCIITVLGVGFWNWGSDNSRAHQTLLVIISDVSNCRSRSESCRGTQNRSCAGVALLVMVWITRIIYTSLSPCQKYQSVLLAFTFTSKRKTGKTSSRL